MAQKKRLSPNQLAEIKSNFAGLRQIQNYAPQNQQFTVNAIGAIEAELDDLLAQEAQMIDQLATVRDEIADKSTDLVQRMNGATQQVIAQFGDDSAEIQSIGRKRKSDRAPYRRTNEAEKNNK